MALTNDERERIAYDIEALKNDITLMNSEMNQWDDAAAYVDGNGNPVECRDYSAEIANNWKTIDELQAQLLDG